MDTHVDDLLAVLEFEDVRDAVLVGHSYGGMVITACERVGAAGSRAWCTSTRWCRGRECAYDLMDPAITAQLRLAVDEHGDGWRVPAGPGVACSG